MSTPKCETKFRVLKICGAVDLCWSLFVALSHGTKDSGLVWTAASLRQLRNVKLFSRVRVEVVVYFVET